MTDQEINIKIAELCGWKQQTICTDMQGIPWPSDPPNYAADLNACHEFEEGLTAEQWCEYDKLLPLHDPQKSHCTSRQRCEAFLRVHDQWEET